MGINRILIKNQTIKSSLLFTVLHGVASLSWRTWVNSRFGLGVAILFSFTSVAIRSTPQRGASEGMQGILALCYIHCEYGQAHCKI